MIKSECKCKRVMAMRMREDGDDDKGVKVICVSCKKDIWRSEKLEVREFIEDRENIMAALGYDENGDKIYKGKTRTLPVRGVHSEDRTDVVLSDKELLMWRIDMALDNRDEVAFRALVRELEGRSNG